MIPVKRILTLSVIFLLLVLHAQPSRSSNDQNRILSLVDYIGGDYGNAVRDGQVINEDEYREMEEFSAGVGTLFAAMKSAEGDKAGIESDINKLSALIRDKGL